MLFWSYYNYWQMEERSVEKPTFKDLLRLHSYEKNPLLNEQIPIFQTTQIPYDYYFRQEINADLNQLHFYNIICDFGPLLAEIKHFQVLPEKRGFFREIFGDDKRQKKIALYMRYFNHTLSEWIELKQNRGGVVAEEEIIYIIMSLLPVAVKYREVYNAPTRIFYSKNIFVNNTKHIFMYPTQFSPQTHKTSFDLERSHKHLKVQKSYSLGSNSYFSTLYSSRAQQFNQATSIKTTDEDLTDIFLIVMELLTFKTRDYFYSQKHQMIKWDLVNQFISDLQVISHLNHHFLCMLKEIIAGKISTCLQFKSKLDQYLISKKEAKYLSLQIQPKLLKNRMEIIDEIYKSKRHDLNNPLSKCDLRGLKRYNTYI